MKHNNAFEASNDDLNIYRMNIRKRSKWEIIATYPDKPRWFPNVTICGNKLYVIGGLNKVEIDNNYKPKEGVCSIIQDLEHNKLAIEKYSDFWVCDLTSQKWEKKENAPRTFNDRGFSYKDRWIICTGGNTSIDIGGGKFTDLRTYYGEGDFCTYSNEAWAYDTINDTWSTLSSLPYGIMSHAIAPYENKVYLLGNEAIRKTHNTLFEGTISVE